MNAFGRIAGRASLMASAAAVAVSFGASAQDAPERILVTGTRIPQANLVGVSPVTALGQDDFQLQGVTRVEDLVNNLPQAFAVQGSQVSNGATGTATVNLRNLGSVRTLVLINGRRMPAGSPFGVAPDLNQIPSALVQRVEVLTGGASATYGSDALSGVVNFIMLDDFEGVRIDSTYSFYQHENDHEEFRSVVAGAGNALAEDTVWDGYQFSVTGVVGANTPDGRGNVTGYLGYRSIDPISQADRDISACAFGGAYTCVGSTTIPEGRFTDFGGFNFGPGFDPALDVSSPNPTPGNPRLPVPDGIPDLGFDFIPSGTSFVPRAGTTYNFGPLNFFQRPDERYTAGLFARYEINRHAEAYGSFMFMDDRTDAQIAPSGTFFNFNPPGVTPTISCSNPLLSAQQVNEICTRYGLLPTDSQVVYIGKRNVEGGPRNSDLRHTSFRMTAGVRGELGGGWDYDLYGLYGNVHLANNYQNELLISRFTNALTVVPNPAVGGVAGVATGAPVCAVTLAGTDPSCVPYDLFSEGSVSPAALNYVSGAGFLDGNTTIQSMSGAITGDLGQYGGQSPYADEAIGLAFGLEYRRETLEIRPDSAFAPFGAASTLSDLSGQGGPTLPVAGSFDVAEFFIESRIPLVQNRPGFSQLGLDLGYRYSDYSTGVDTDTYKLGADWAPVEDFRFRASFQRAVRVANVVELFSTRQVALFNGTDPCAGTAPAATLAQCQNSGVTAGQYGGIAPNPAGQYNQFTSGNTALDPESSDTISFGLVASPRWVPGLNVSIDYFNITVEDLIGPIGAQTILTQCVQSGDPTFCGFVARSGTGSLWNTPIAGVGNPNVNTGSLETSGIDLNISYALDFADVGMSNAGGLRFELVGTWLDELIAEPVSGFTPAPTAAFGSTTYDCAGYHGPVCGTPSPEWRHRFRTTWDTPWNASLSLTWRYFDSVEYEGVAPNDFLNGGANALDLRGLPAMSYFDLAGTWQLLENTQLRAGVNNILDETAPPVSNSVGAPFSNGNTYPVVYDALGRYIFFGLTTDF